jgi:hypothetical protein
MARDAGHMSALRDFERTYIEKLRLAAQVILEAASDGDLVGDGLEVELGIFKDRVEFALLLPEHSAELLPWRKLAEEVSDEISGENEQ